MPSKNPFEVLGISPEAEPEVILAAYRALTKKYHPDLNPGVPPSQLNARMSDLNWARAELGRDLSGWRAKVNAETHPRSEGDAPPGRNAPPPNRPSQKTPPPESSAKSQASTSAHPSAQRPGFRTRLGARALVGATLVIIIGTASIYGARYWGSPRTTVATQQPSGSAADTHGGDAAARPRLAEFTRDAGTASTKVFLNAASPPTLDGSLEFGLDIDVSGVDNLAGYQFTLTSDSGLLSIESAQNADYLSSSGREVVCPDPTMAAQSVRLSCVTLRKSPLGPSGGGTITHLRFRATQPGTARLSFSNVQLVHPDGAMMASTSYGGVVVIK